MKSLEWSTVKGMVKVSSPPHRSMAPRLPLHPECPLQQWRSYPRRHAAWLIRGGRWGRLLCLLLPVCCSAVTRPRHPLPWIWFHSGNITFSFLDWARHVGLAVQCWVSVLCSLATAGVNVLYAALTLTMIPGWEAAVLQQQACNKY